MDTNQEIFLNFEVPDKSRILKVKNWLIKNNILRNELNLSVLEIGYAKGGLLYNLQEFNNIDKYAVDINPHEEANNVKFFQYDCNQGLPNFSNKQFDIVFAGEVIEHIVNDMTFLKEIHGVLKDNGILCLTTPNLFFLVNRFIIPFGFMPFFSYEPYHYHIYSPRILSQIVKESGFKVSDVKSSHIFISSRRNKVIGSFFEWLGDFFPNFGASIILFAKKL